MVIERALKNNHHRVNDRIRIRGTMKKGTVIEVIKDYSRIRIEKGRPLFLVVHFDSGEKAVCNPGQIKGCK